MTLAGNIKLQVLTENKFVAEMNQSWVKGEKKNILIYDPALDPLFHL